MNARPFFVLPAAALAGPLFLLLFLVFLLAACGGGARARLERGLELEARGEAVQAALAYVAALERDSALEAARLRLEGLAPTLFQAWEGRTGALLSEGSGVEAGEETLSFSEVVARGPRVGVRIPVPQDWSSRRREVLGEAVEGSLLRAAEEGRLGRWSSGIRVVEGALERFEPSPAQARALHNAWTDLLVEWGRSELASLRPRAAFLHFQEAAFRMTPVHHRWHEIGQLQGMALEAGSVRVAFLPLQATERAAGAAPPGFREALNEILQLEHWTLPPPFILSASPVEVRRELDRIRRERERRGVSPRSTEEAAEVGRALGAHRVVLPELESFTRDTTGVRSQERTAPLRGGGSARYLVRTGTVRISATLAFLVVDPASRRSVEQRSLTLRTSAELRDGLYGGNPETLDVSIRERLLFDRAEQEAREEEAMEELQDLLARRLAEEVFQRLLARIR